MFKRILRAVSIAIYNVSTPYQCALYINHYNRQQFEFRGIINIVNYHDYDHNYNYNYTCYILLCPGIIGLQNNDNNHNKNHVNVNTNNWKRKRNSSAAFSNHSTATKLAKEEAAVEPKTKKKNVEHVSKPHKAQIMKQTKLNPTATPGEIIQHFHFAKLSNPSTIQSIKKDAHLVTEKESLALESDDRCRARTRVDKFPATEAELLRRREERVKSNRDRSKCWMQRETRKIINDEECSTKLKLTEFEKENVDKFKGSLGYVNEVVDGEWTNQTTVKSANHCHLFKRSWTNFGSHLPFDGSKDGNVNTIGS